MSYSDTFQPRLLATGDDCESKLTVNMGAARNLKVGIRSELLLSPSLVSQSPGCIRSVIPMTTCPDLNSLPQCEPTWREYD